MIRSKAAWILGTLGMLVPLIGYPIDVLDPAPGVPPMSLAERVIGALIASMWAMLFWHAGRLRTVVDADGVKVYGYMRRITLPWSVIGAFTLTNALRVQVMDGRLVGIPGFMAGAGRAPMGNPSGRRALRQLTELKAAHSPAAGVRPSDPTRYKPYFNIWVFLGIFALFLLIALA